MRRVRWVLSWAVVAAIASPLEARAAFSLSYDQTVTSSQNDFELPPGIHVLDAGDVVGAAARAAAMRNAGVMGAGASAEMTQLRDQLQGLQRQLGNGQDRSR